MEGIGWALAKGGSDGAISHMMYIVNTCISMYLCIYESMYLLFNRLSIFYLCTTLHVEHVGYPVS